MCIPYMNALYLKIPGLMSIEYEYPVIARIIFLPVCHREFMWTRVGETRGPVRGSVLRPICKL